MARNPSFYGVDESGDVGRRLVIVAYSTEDIRNTHRRWLGEKKRGFAARNVNPKESFLYTVLGERQLEFSREIYREPRTRIEKSWNDRYHEFRLRADATALLLSRAGFADGDRAFVDSYCRCVVLRNEIADALGKKTGVEIFPRSIVCTLSADLSIPVVRRADETAYFIAQRGIEFADKRTDITEEDIAKLHGARHKSYEQPEDFGF
ncbi:MAG: hypothetical protein HY513_01355 [Candidatus Aenigmarchaeota archaeon]|nr:hypothetical protein [Candidatus Aenigmarchaeota archaeon]